MKKRANSFLEPKLHWERLARSKEFHFFFLRLLFAFWFGCKIFCEEIITLLSQKKKKQDFFFFLHYTIEDHQYRNDDNAGLKWERESLRTKSTNKNEINKSLYELSLQTLDLFRFIWIEENRVNWKEKEILFLRFFFSKKFEI